VPNFYNKDMAELAHQLTLSPRRLRAEQLRGIEKLLELVEAGKAYPFEFVCYHITKYRKRGTGSTSSSATGKALIADLITTAEILSRKSGVTVAEMEEVCATHAEAAKELQVSTKTIRRWRNRGLMGLRLTYPDGVSRLAFLRRTMDRFVRQHGDLVARGAAFRQLSVKERDGIVARARELFAVHPMKLHAAAKVIADETGRAVETVRYTLRRYDEAHKDSAIFKGKGEVLFSERDEAIWKCRQNGDSVAAIAAVYETTTEDIEGVLRGVQVALWKRTPLECIPNELFDAPNADELILNVPEPAVEERGAAARIPTGLPPYLKSLYAMPLLSREQEQDLFRRYNYLKFKIARLLKGIKGSDCAVGLFEEISGRMSLIDELRRRIIRANLRLVVSIAKRHAGWAASFFEVVSDGNVSLMRAVERFDYARGNKFSTYATWAIMKNYARTIPEQRQHQTRYATGQDIVFDTVPDRSEVSTGAGDREHIRKLIADGLQSLEEREREIVSHHFGLAEGSSPQTLEQLGARFGVTKERVRQIEQRALSQLRSFLGPAFTDALTA